MQAGQGGASGQQEAITPPRGPSNRLLLGLGSIGAAGALFGWWQGVPALTSWGATATTSVLTALLLVGVLASLTLRWSQDRRSAALVTALLVVVCVLAPDLLEAAVRLALPAANVLPSPGTLIAVALLLAAGRVRPDRPGSPDILLALGAVAVTAVSLVGLVLRNQDLVAAGAASTASGLSVPTAALVALCTVAVIRRSTWRLRELPRWPLAGLASAPLLALLAALSGRDLYLVVVAVLTAVALGATLQELSLARRDAADLADAMLRSTPAATLLVRSDGVIVAANDAASALFGWPVDALVGGPVDRLLPAEQRAVHADLRAGFHAGGDLHRQMRSDSVGAVRADGSTFSVEVWLSAVVVKGEQMVVTTINDVTDVVDHIAALEDLQAMQRLLLTTVTHDLRSPLTVITGMARLLSDGREDLDEATQADLADRIVQNAAKLDQLITDLLDLERLRRGGLTVLSTIDLGDAAEHAGASAAQLGVDAQVGSVRGLPPVVAEPVMLRRIIDNLLGNAAKYAPGPVEVRWSQEDEGVWLIVEDHGQGVPMASRDRVFDVFERGTVRDAGIQGTGVGLSLVAEFARRAGGRALVTDRTDGAPGASFRVWFPAGERRLRVAGTETADRAGSSDAAG